MPTSIKKVAFAALHLPQDQRLSLAHQLLSSIEPNPNSKVEAAWDTEIRQRIARYDDGNSQSVKAAKVFEELDRRLK